MAEEVYPFDNSPAATEVQWSRMARLWHVDGVDGLPSGSNLRVTAGSGLSVNITAGHAMVRGVFYRLDTTKNIGLETNGASTARIDKIVLRINTTTNVGTIIAIEGTAATSPVAPTTTYTDTIFDLPLADVRVEANDTISTVTDRRQFVDRGYVPCTSTNRPNPRSRPMLAWEEDQSRFVYTSGDGVWRVGFGDDSYRPTEIRSTDAGSTNSTNWTSTLGGTQQAGIILAFDAPPSGRIRIVFGSYIYNLTADAQSYITAALSTAGGTVVHDNGAIQAFTRQPNGGGMGTYVYRQRQISGLTPGNGYVAALRHRVTAGEATFDDRFLEIQPLP